MMASQGKKQHAIRVPYNANGPSLLTGRSGLASSHLAPQIGQLSNLFIEDIIRLFELEPLIQVPVSPFRKGRSCLENTDSTVSHTSGRSSQIGTKLPYNNTTAKEMRA